MAQHIQPLSFPVSLAKNPKQKPIYSQVVKTQDGKELPVGCPSATRALVALMDMQAVMGGAASHFGGPSAFAEIMSSLYGMAFKEGEESNTPWYEKYHIINDAGHCENGIYALKANYGFADLSIDSLKGFRSIESKLTGHGEAHIFPEGVYLSNGPLGSSIGQAQGLAYADYLAGNLNRVTVTTISDGACMEGEAKEAMAAIPGLAAKGELAPFLMVVSDNNTKLSGRIDEESYSMKPTFESLSDLGWEVIKLKDPHNLQSCYTAIERAAELAKKNPNKPVALHAFTIKGYGTKKTEESASGAHGFPLKTPKDLNAFIGEIYGTDDFPQEFKDWASEMVTQEEQKVKSEKAPTEKVQVGISKALNDKRAAGLPVVSVSSDLAGSTGTAGFQKAQSTGIVDVGVAESNMVSMAAGLSKQGFIPVVDTFSQFGATKGALPLIMASLSNAPVIAVFSHAGFQDAADGASHQALSYFSMVSSIPNVEVYCLTSSSEAYHLVSQAIDTFADDRKNNKTPKSYVFYLGRETFPASYIKDESQYKLGQAQVVFDNVQDQGAATISASGPLLHQAIEAAYELEKEGVQVRVINPAIINTPDTATFSNSLRSTQNNLVTVEDHQVIGGMGAMLSHSLKMEGCEFKLKSLGVQGGFGQSAYLANELYAKHGLDKEAIKKAVKEI